MDPARPCHARRAAVASLLAMDLGYAIYMEDLGGARDGIIDAAPPPYEVR